MRKVAFMLNTPQFQISGFQSIFTYGYPSETSPNRANQNQEPTKYCPKFCKNNMLSKEYEISQMGNNQDFLVDINFQGFLLVMC